MHTNENSNDRNRVHVKHCLLKGLAIVLVLGLCIGTIGVVQANASSKLARPKCKLMKRDKKMASLKVSNSKGVTGYRIYLKSGKKAKWKLHDFVLHSSKIKLTKLKPNKVYYIRLRAWRTQGHSIQLSAYSRTIKIDKYKKKTHVASSPKPSPTTSPAVTPDPGNVSVTSGSAVMIPQASSTPLQTASLEPDMADK